MKKLYLQKLPEGFISRAIFWIAVLGIVSIMIGSAIISVAIDLIGLLFKKISKSIRKLLGGK